MYKLKYCNTEIDYSWVFSFSTSRNFVVEAMRHSDNQPIYVIILHFVLGHQMVDLTPLPLRLCISTPCLSKWGIFRIVRTQSYLLSLPCQNHFFLRYAAPWCIWIFHIFSFSAFRSLKSMGILFLIHLRSVLLVYITR